MYIGSSVRIYLRECTRCMCLAPSLLPSFTAKALRKLRRDNPDRLTVRFVFMAVALFLE